MKIMNQAQAGVTAGLKAVSNPISIVMFILSMYLFYNPTPLTNFSNTLQKSVILKPIGTFISQHLSATAGLVWLVPLAFVSAPPSWAFLAAITTGLITTELLAVPTKYWEYAFLGVSLALLLRARSATQFSVAILLMIVTIGLGIWGSELFASSD